MGMASITQDITPTYRITKEAWTCDHCGKTFSTGQAISDHWLTTYAVGPHTVDFCSRDCRDQFVAALGYPLQEAE